jgi:hypothetical protein
MTIRYMTIRYLRAVTGGAALLLALAVWGAPARAETPTPEANKPVHFPDGTWAAVPQSGPDGKVRQCVLVAFRDRKGEHGPIETRFSFTIGRGAGFAINLTDDSLPSEQVLDDEAELLIDGKSFPAVAFTLGPMAQAKALAVHPGDAAGALAALGKAKQLAVRSDGAGIDSGPITLQLPTDALGYLKSCGKRFDIAIDRPTDPDANDLPVPRPRSPRVAMLQPGASSDMPGIEDIQKIEGWDASELRAPDGTIDMCYIRRRYSERSGANVHMTVTALLVGRAGGFRILLKDSDLHLTADQQLDATVSVGGKPLDGLVSKVMSVNEIGIFPAHAKACAAALDNTDSVDFKSKVVGVEFPLAGGAIGWARACARRSGIAFEPGAGL